MVNAAGRQFHAWLDVINNRPINDTTRLDKFMKENFPSRPEDLNEKMHELHNMRTGGLELKRVDEDTDTRFVALLQDGTRRAFKQAVMDVGAEEPWPITKLEVEAAPTPSEFATRRVSEREAIEAFRQYLDEEAAADRFSGAVLVAKGGETLFTRACGLQDREHNIPNSLETRFTIASMNKMFAALSVLQLDQQGMLGLHEPIGRYLPDYPDKEAAAKITTHHLLTHTSGVISDMQVTWGMSGQLATLEDRMKVFGAMGLEFEPGTKWAYTNFGFTLLNLLVERVAKQDYVEYVRQHIFQVAEMPFIGYEPNEQRDSFGYMKLPGSNAWARHAGPGGAGSGRASDAGGTARVKGDGEAQARPSASRSTGGAMATVEDFKCLADAFIGHRLLDTAHTDLMVEGQFTAGILGRQEAYGWETAIENGARCISRSGSGSTANGELRIYPDSGYIVVALANITAPAAITMTTFIGDRLPDR